MSLLKHWIKNEKKKKQRGAISCTFSNYGNRIKEACVDNNANE